MVAVTVERLDHFYGEGASRSQVLFANNLAIEAGELVVMTGPSGAGKTTLLTLIGALRTVQAGRVEVLGRNLSRQRENELAAVRGTWGSSFRCTNWSSS